MAKSSMLVPGPGHEWRGKPTVIRLDNGPQYVAQSFGYIAGSIGQCPPRRPEGRDAAVLAAVAAIVEEAGV